MSTSHRVFACIACAAGAGCAVGAVEESPYDEVARIVGGALIGSNGGGELGAVADSAMLARDRTPPGFVRLPTGVIEGNHGDAVHRYFLVCTDANGFATATCGPTTEQALVFAYWYEPGLRRGGHWTIEHPAQDARMVAGNTWLEYRDGAYALDDSRELMLLIETDYGWHTAGAMRSNLILDEGNGEGTRFIHGDLELTKHIATLTLDGVHTTEHDARIIIVM
jgi:hypothetical protein